MKRGGRIVVLWGTIVALIVAGCALSSSTSTGGNVNSSSGASPPPTTTTTTTTTTTPAAPQTFNGNGTENLGTISVPTDSLLTWQCSCTQGMFIMTTGSNWNVIDINQSGTSGQSEVSADTYPNVQVITDGSFTITITANG